MRTFVVAFVFGSIFFIAPTGRADAVKCINIYHDEAQSGDSRKGPINTIMLANLLGHWPQYEIRARPIDVYTSSDLEECGVTIYLGSGSDPEIPDAFLNDFFSTTKRIAWIGFGSQELDAKEFDLTFRHRVAGQVSADDQSRTPGFYQIVNYKNQVFRKSLEFVEEAPVGAFEAMKFVPTKPAAVEMVVAKLIHNKSHRSIPYFLRSGTKFVVGDVPFSYMHEGDRYFAFADLLFDILDEQPQRSRPLAFARTEDIHGYYERELLNAAFQTHNAEGVPISIAHIPLFADPFNAYGAGVFRDPVPASGIAEFVQLIRSVSADRRNAIIMHGVTHQFGDGKNPHTGTSGDDYEFWDMTGLRPVPGDSVSATLDRLVLALPVFDAYGIKPRYWVTPHYHASALDSRVFAKVFPWQVGRVTYYPSSFKNNFIIPAQANRDAMPAVTQERLSALRSQGWPDLDEQSVDGLTQMFPYEIYRDVYGQRIIPETLGYLSYATSDQTGFVRTVDNMLADARRSLVVRDYWASFFYHPYLFASKENGGIGKHQGDAHELRKLFVGLKLLGYTFIGLPEFEDLVHTSDHQSVSVSAPPRQ